MYQVLYSLENGHVKSFHHLRFSLPLLARNSGQSELVHVRRTNQYSRQHNTGTKRGKYRKIPKISPRAYIFQKPFLRGLFLEGLIFGGAYLRSEICVSKSIGLALLLEVNLPLLLCFTLYLRAIFQVQAPDGLTFGGAI